jgi:hypothetical protein
LIHQRIVLERRGKDARKGLYLHRQRYHVHGGQADAEVR